MTAKTSNFSGLLYYNPASHGFSPVTSATIYCPDSMNEYDSITVNVVTWNFPDHRLFWRVVPYGTNLTLDRFTLGSSDSALLANNRASFTIAVSADNRTSLDGQSFDIIISKTLNGPALATKYGVNVNDTSLTPTFSVTPRSSSVNEGDTAIFDIATTNFPNGYVYFTVTGLSAADYYANAIPHGDTYVDGGASSVSFGIAADLTTEGTETLTFQLRTGSESGPIVSQCNVTVNDTSQTPTNPTYSLATQGSVTSINEGDPLTFNVTTTGVANGTTLYYYLGNTGSYSIDAGRFYPSTMDSFTINNNSGSFFVAVAADSITATGTQSYNIRISTTYPVPTGVGNTLSITINDTSQNPTYSISPNSTSINEGDTVTFTITTTNVNNGTTLYHWSGGTIGIGRLTGNQGTVTVNSNTASFTVTVSANQFTDGAGQDFYIVLGLGNLSDIVATSATVSVADTSQTPASGVPTGSIVGQWNSPGVGQFGGDPIIWPEASGYSWAKVYHVAGITPGGNGTIGYASDGSTSYIQTPIHMTPGDFTLAFTARLNPTGTFPQGIFDCSQSGAYTGLRAYWTDATHIVITSPGTGTGAIDMTGSGWHTYGPSFFTIRMKLDNIANTGSIDVFVNGTAWSNVGAPRGANGFPEADASIKMILGALVNDSGTKVGFLDSTWFNFIYYSRALSNSEVTQLYTAQQAGLLNPTPATTYSFVSNFTASQASSNIYISIGFGGLGPKVPPEQMGTWYVSGPGIADVATVTATTAIINDSQFYVTIDQSILQGSGTYTFTAP